MSSALRKSEPVTIADFDAFTEREDDSGSFDLVDGVIYMMSNPTGTHEQIVANIATRLKDATDKKKCQTFIGGMRVQRSDDLTELFKVKPDIVAHCGLRVTGTYLTTPQILVEVLSPSTMDNDRGRKLEFYKSLPSVQHIALVYQDQMRVEHYRREGDEFKLHVFTKSLEHLAFEDVEFRIDLSRIYFDTGL